MHPPCLCSGRHLRQARAAGRLRTQMPPNPCPGWLPAAGVPLHSGLWAAAALGVQLCCGRLGRGTGSDLLAWHLPLRKGCIIDHKAFTTTKGQHAHHSLQSVNILQHPSTAFQPLVRCLLRSRASPPRPAAPSRQVQIDGAGNVRLQNAAPSQPAAPPKRMPVPPPPPPAALPNDENRPAVGAAPASGALPVPARVPMGPPAPMPPKHLR
jgi:hypothetical protein